MDESFWLMTTAAATVATAISTGLTLWLRQRDRPDVHWHITSRESRPADTTKDELVFPRDLFRLVNAGDGTAYRVEVMASGGQTVRFHDERWNGRVWGDQSMPVVRPGEALTLMVRHEGKPIDVVLRVSWIPEPTRLSRPVIEWIPLAEGVVSARTGRRSGAKDWRWRELRWWQVLQRFRQWASRRARNRHFLVEVRARKAMQEWKEQVEVRLKSRQGEDQPEGD